MSITQRIKIIDITCRDAHQCLWMTRMTNAMMLPFAARHDQIGFAAIDVLGGAVFDVAVRYLKEDPFQRIRLMRERVKQTPLHAIVRGQSLWTFEAFPDDIVELAMQRLAANGIRWVTIYDAINDIRNLEVVIPAARRAGLRVTGAFVYMTSPIHTDAFYVQKARELCALGVDEVMIKDPPGLMTPERVRTLVPALKAAIGEVVLQLHSHCGSGLGPICALESVKLGVETLYTATRPLANGWSHPAADYIHRQLTHMGYETGLDEKPLLEMADYYTAVAKRHNLPIGRIAEYDPFLWHHQMPGGMITNLINQLRENGVADRLEAILEEIGNVMKDIGYAPMVSPLAQFIATQAVLNVMQGERYKTVPDELRKYLLGHYGRPQGPVDPDVLDKVTGGAQPVDVRCGADVPPAIPRLRRERGPFRSDDDLLLAAFYREPILQPLYEERECHDYARIESAHPLKDLLKEIARRPEVRYFSLRGPGDRSMEYVR